MGTEEKQINLHACSRRIADFNRMTQEELEHIASCEFCAEEYANAIEKNAMIKAPHYLKEEIMQKTGALLRKNDTARSLLPWKKIQLFSYSLKIGLAMCGALVLLNLVPTGNIQRNEPSGTAVFINKLNTDLRNFSDSILEYTELLTINRNMDYKEGFKYDKEEK